MDIYRVTKDSPRWQLIAYDYVRTDAFCFGQGIPVETEFSHDDPIEQLNAVIIIDDHKPVGGCRITYPEEGIGKIGRVCVIRDRQKTGIGRRLIEEAEAWIAEHHAKHIVITSQDRAAGFYNKLGYVTNLQEDPRRYEPPRPPETKEQRALHKDLGFGVVLVEKYL